MFQRKHLQAFITRMKEPRRFIQVIMGPRQVGKTTMITQLSQNLQTELLYFSADAVPAINSTWLEQQWGNCPLKIVN